MWAKTSLYVVELSVTHFATFSNYLGKIRGYRREDFISLLAFSYAWSPPQKNSWGWVPGVKCEKVKHRDYRGDPQLSPDAKFVKICSANVLKIANNSVLANQKLYIDY